MSQQCLFSLLSASIPGYTAGCCRHVTSLSSPTKDGWHGDEWKDISRHLGDHLPADRRGVHSSEEDSDSHHPSSLPDPEASRTHQQDDGAADRRDNPGATSEGNFMLSVHYKAEDEDIVQRSSGENLIPLNVPPGLHSTDPSYNPPNYEEPSPDQSQMVTTSVGQDEGKRLQCGECGKQSTKNSGILKERIIHTGAKRFTCSECGRCFRSKASLIIHERIHTGEKPYSCPECGRCFASKSLLTAHKRVHTGEKPYSCSDCKRCFRSKATLIIHERIHTGEKPFSCSECEKCFTNQSDLVKHKRIHTGEKPYSCSECGKCFITKGKLIDHHKTHTKSKMPICTKTYTGEETYTCAECGTPYVNKAGFNLHQKKHREEKQKLAQERSHIHAPNVGIVFQVNQILSDMRETTQ
ncbi:zinc finger protein 585B-like isoform X1 [Eleutherodactylus coqui]|uniref:zinc finger protein 585B-like isoform X1 n=1 Tax=Eleutherodactylus coqui TaxID=57060 RepID=UPI00346268AD